ncbi:hypothetical protein ACLB2K_047666 [Fragaria x ananassa]
MASSQSTQDIGSAPPMEQVLEMLAKLNDQMDGLDTIQQSVTEQGMSTQQSIADLTEQLRQNKAFLLADQDKKIESPNEDFNGHVSAEKIELPGSRSSGEDFPLDKPTSKEEITLSINDFLPDSRSQAHAINLFLVHEVARSQHSSFLFVRYSPPLHTLRIVAKIAPSGLIFFYPIL